jgi:hypothetical protein
MKLTQLEWTKSELKHDSYGLNKFVGVLILNQYLKLDLGMNMQILEPFVILLL